MGQSLTLNLAALFAMVPVSLVSARAGAARNAAYWLLLGAAVLGPSAGTAVILGGAWHTDLVTALWVSVSASAWIFAVAAVIVPHAWRLTPLFMPLLLALGLMAVLGSTAVDPESGGARTDESRWFWLHIGVSVATYALLSVSAVAALAAALQEHALKRKQPDGFARRLPAVLECERIVIRFLWLAEGVLGLGLLSGIAINAAAGTAWLTFDHKTIFAVAAFAVIGILLLAHQRSGVRGKRAARLVLLAYLLVTFAYPGVKFVTDVLIRG